MLSASQSPDKDVLWLVESDMFPFQSSLIESYVSHMAPLPVTWPHFLSHDPTSRHQVKLPVEGRTWAIAECIEAGELEAISSPLPLPPAVVTQHAHPSRQFIVVSTQGSYLISKHRPVDQLQCLLEASKGGCSEAVRSFFKLHRVRRSECIGQSA